MGKGEVQFTELGNKKYMVTISRYLKGKNSLCSLVSGKSVMVLN